MLSKAERDAVHERHWSLVGRVAQNSASVEMSLRSLMIGLLDSKYAGIIAAGQSASDLIENCLALMQANQEISDEARERGQNLLRSLRPLFAQRNNVVHAPWFSATREDDLTETISLVSKRRAPLRPTVINYAEVEKLSSDLNEAIGKLWDWTYGEVGEAARRPQVNY
ncbi:hypothetical protein CFP59_04456 [Streptomyces malaysiensis subsp. malaysiensis]|nr:hypothetical protein CFP59_04456 [Streptomyces sp. M56]